MAKGSLRRSLCRAFPGQARKSLRNGVIMMKEQSSHVGDMPISELFLLADELNEADIAEVEAEFLDEAEAKEEGFNGTAADPAHRSLAEMVVLACAEQFQKLGLRLYEGIYGLDGGLQGGWLIGNGEEQFLGVLPSENGDAYFTGEMPILHYPTDDTAQEKLNSLPNYIKLCLRGGKVKGSCWVDPLRPVPPEFHEKMVRARLIKPRFGSYIWEPTPLGARYGLVHGFMLLDGRRTCHTFFIQAASLDALKDLLTGGRPNQGAQESRKIIPLEERLNRMAVGLPGNDAYAVELVRRLGDMPLGQYMGQCPDKLEQLRKELPGGPVNTVREAAARISEVWHTPGCSMEQCKNLIWLLLVMPMVDGMKQFQKFEGRT